MDTVNFRNFLRLVRCLFPDLKQPSLGVKGLNSEETGGMVVGPSRRLLYTT